MIAHRVGASVVITTCDRPEGAAALLRSVLGQRGYRGGLEALVVNDHGDERVLDTVRAVAGGQLIPVRCFDTGYSGFGAVLARNIGLRFARYDTAIFLDDDVRVGEDLVARYQQAPEGLRLGRIDFQVESDGAARIIEERRPILRGEDRVVEDYLPFLGYLWGANFAVPTRLALVVGGLDEAFLDENEEDVDFGARLMLASRRLVVAPSARAIHLGPDSLLKWQLGLPFADRPRRAEARFQRRTHLVVNGGLDYWAGERWERCQRWSSFERRFGAGQRSA